MIPVTSTYMQECRNPIAKRKIVAKYGLYNKQAKPNIDSAIANEKQPFSSINNTIAGTKSTNYNYISCEPNRVTLGGDFYFLSDKNSNTSLETIAYWSSSMSNENGEFETSPRITYHFKTPIDFSNITLYFSEVCSDFSILYYYNDILKATAIVENNNSLSPETKITGVDAQTKFDRLVITFNKTAQPQRYIKFLTLDFGVIKEFTSIEIKDMSIIDELSIDSKELSANSLTLTINDQYREYDFLNPRNKLAQLQEKQEITVYHYLMIAGKYNEIPLGTFLLKNFNYKDKSLILEAYDDTYFMNKIYYGGNFYNNALAKDVLKDLFEYFNYTKYEINEEDFADIRLTGYVPNVEFREALRLIAEASQAVVNKNRYGITKIFRTFNDRATQRFRNSVIEDAKPSKNLYNNVIDIVEYSYAKDDSILTSNQVYKSELDAGTHTLVFDTPIDPSTLKQKIENTDYEIKNVYALSCVVEVITKTEVVLEADKYKVTSTINRVQIKRENEEEVDDYAIDKIENTLITKDNGTLVANWKLDKNDIKFDFNTFIVPYVEVGDTCLYETGYNEEDSEKMDTKKFIPTRLEFSMSFKQGVEG